MLDIVFFFYFETNFVDVFVLKMLAVVIFFYKMLMSAYY